MLFRSNDLDSDKKIASPRVADLPELPPAKGHQYPAICHDVTYRKGVKMDHGWKIRWFYNLEEASRVDAEARREAERFYIARQIYKKNTAEAKPANLPVVPPKYNPVKKTPQEILAMAGFSEHQYRVREDVEHWYNPKESGWRDPDEGWVAGRPASARLAYKNKDGVWEIGTTGLQDLMETMPIKDAWALSVLSEMGADEAQVKASLDAEIEGEKKIFAEEVSAFVGAIRDCKEFFCFSREEQEEVIKLYDWCQPEQVALVVTMLQARWGIAKQLNSLKEQGEILVSWGGHFRVMGGANNQQYWVIRPDGAEREAEDVEYRKRYTSEGNKFWRIVDREELAISWSKGNSAALHNFTVNHLPVGGLTSAQKETVSRIEDTISGEWNDAGDASLRKGWGISGRAATISAAQTTTPGGGNTVMAEALRKAGLIK